MICEGAKRCLAVVTVSFLGVGGGCDRAKGENVEGARRAIPESSSIQVKLPGASASKVRGGQGDINSEQLALLGATAQFYGITRATTVELNTGAAFVLTLARTIVSFPVTSVDGDTYIWGPWSEALSPSQYRMTVRETDAGDFEWAIEGRLKADGTDAVFSPVVTGVATPGDPHRGSGSFHASFDEAERLDPAGNRAEGQLDVVYDLESTPITVVMDYEKSVVAADGTSTPVTFHYAYAEAADGSGDFQFTLHGDLDDVGGALEDAEVRSRWLATGAGRADLRVRNGDLGSAILTGTECWDTSFGRTYWTDSLGWQPVEGDAASCVFTDARLPGE